MTSSDAFALYVEIIAAKFDVIHRGDFVVREFSEASVRAVKVT